MSENQKIVIQTEIDASSVKPTLDKTVADVNAAAKKIDDAGKTADPFSGVSAGAEKAAKAAKTGAEQISEAVKKAGTPSGQTPDPFGPVREKMEQTVPKIDRATRQLAGIIQRTEAEVGTAGKGSVEYIERLARLKGADLNFLQPYLDSLRRAQEAQRAATTGIDGMGMSAKATSAALRQLPAQFTDIVVSLQGGQQPLTVLLQQGGQLKDVFGSVGAAAAAMGNYIAGLITPVTTLAAAVGVLALAYKQGSDESDSFRNALILTGNAAGTTVGGLQRMAAAVAEVTGSTKGAAAEALVALANSSDIATSRFEKFAAVAVQANKLTGAAIGDTVKAFSDLGEKPLEASVKLNEKTRFLTVALYDQIKALEDQGRASDAAALAQNAYADTLTKRLGDIRDNLGYLESGWSKITGAAKSAWDAMLDIGREKTPEQQLDRFNKQLQNSAALAELARKRGQTVGTGSTESDEITGLQEIVRLRDRAARAAADEAARVQDKIKWDKMGEGFQDKGVKLQRELNAQIELGTKALKDGSITADEYSRRISGVLEKYRDKSTPKAPEADPFRAINAEIQKRIELTNQQLAQGAPLTAWEKARIENEAKIAEAIRKARELGKPVNQREVEQARASARLEEDAIKRAATQTLLTKQLAEAEAERIKVRAELIADSDKLQARENELALASQTLRVTLEDGLRVQQAEITLMAASAQQRTIALAQLKNRIAYERELQRIDRLDYNTTAEQKDRMRADARMKLETENAMAVTQVWADTAKSINDALTNAFMEAAASGKNIFDALARALEREFASLVLRPVVSALMQPIANQAAGSVAGALGSSGLGDFFSLAGGLGKGVLGGSGQFGVELFGKDFNLGEIAGYLNAASLAAGGKWGQAAGSALGTYAGATMGGPIGAVIGSKIGEAAGERLDVWFGGGTYVQNMGDGRYTYDSAGRITNRESSGAGTTALADQSITSLNSAYRTAARRLGIGTVGAQFGYGSNNSDGGKFIVTSQAGGSGYNSSEVGAGNIELVAARAVLSALQGSELPARLAGIFDAVDINNISKGQIDALLQTAEAINTLGASFDQLGAANVSGLTGEVIQSMADFSGGLEKLAQNLSTYYQEFYTAEEQRQITAKRIATELGKAGAAVSVEEILGATREDFRRVVEQTDPTSPLYAALLNVAGAFADITPVAEEVSNALKEQASWQQKLDVATGKLTERQAQMQNDLEGVTDSTTRSLIEQYYAQLDLKDATKDAATAAEKAAAAMKSFNAASNRIAVSQATLSGATPDQASLIAANGAVSAAVQAIRDAVVAAGNKDGANITVGQIDKFISSKGINDVPTELKATLQSLLADYLDAKVQVKDAQDAIDKAAQDAADAAAKAATDAATSAAQTAAEAAARIAQERAGLQERLDAATLTNVQLLEKQRLALDESNRALFDQVVAAEKAKQVAAERQGLQEQLDQLTLTSTQLLEKQRAALDESNRALFDSIQAAKAEAEAKNAAIQAAKDATDAAFASLQRAVDAQRKAVQAQVDVAQESVSSLESIFDSLKGGIDSLRGTTGGFTGDSAAAFLVQALQTAQATGYLPDQKELADAVTAAVAGVSGKQFKSQADAEFAKLALAGTLTGLKDITGDQLTTAEKALQAAKEQLDALDGILEKAQGQIDAINGVDTSVKSVADAVNALAQAVQTQMAVTAAGGAAGTTKTTGASTTTAANSYVDASKRAGGDTAGLITAFKEAGFSAAQMADRLNSAGGEWSGVTAEDINKFAKSMGLPAFAVGTNYVPQDMLALVHEGEAIVPKAFNPSAIGTGRTEALIEALTAEVQRLQAIVRDGNAYQRRTAEAVNGNPDMPMLVQTV